MRLSVRERILLKISKDDTTGCWNWTGFVQHGGYGTIGIGKRTAVLVHRAAWEAWNGTPIPEGRELHHTCENKTCCNPDHLRAVTRREHLLISPNNIAFIAASVTHCPYGHEYPTTYVVYSGKRRRVCQECTNRRVREFYQRNPEKRREKMRHDSDIRRKKAAANRTHNTSEVDS